MNNKPKLTSAAGRKGFGPLTDKRKGPPQNVPTEEDRKKRIAKILKDAP